MHKARKLIAAGALLSAFATTACWAQDGTLPLGGQPPAGATASVKDFNYQIKYQRVPRPEK